MGLKAVSKLLELCQAWWCVHFSGQQSCPNSFWVKNLFLTSSLNLPPHNFSPLPQVLSLVPTEKKPASERLSACSWKSVLAPTHAPLLDDALQEWHLACQSSPGMEHMQLLVPDWLHEHLSQGKRALGCCPGSEQIYGENL